MVDAALFTPDVPPTRKKPYLQWGVWDDVRTVVGMARNPMTTLSDYQFRLPVFQYSVFGTHFTVINDPDLIKHVFVTNAANYTLEPIRQAILTPALRGGLIATEGEPWKQARRSLAPLFTPKFTCALGEKMYGAAKHAVDAMENEGGITRVGDLTSSIAFNVLSDTLFSGDISGDAEAFMADVSDFFHCLGNVDPLDMVGAPNWVPRPTRLKGRSAVHRLRARISGLIENRRVDKISEGVERPDDILTRLMDAEDNGVPVFSDDLIQDHVMTFLAAGHETTARGMSWLLYLLSNDAEIRDSVEQEVDALDVGVVPPKDWQSRLPRLTACFEEAMRLYPPAPFLTRMAREDDAYQLAFIPAGGYVFLNLYALHRHHMLWENPDTFNPDRFMGDNREKIARYQYLPFGVGHRTCIGGHFAMQEALIILTLLLRKFRFEYAGERPPWPVMRITLKPDNGMPMRIVKRR